MPQQIFPPKITLEASRYDTTTINAVWEKAENEFGFLFFKRDRFGEIIAKHHYGEHSQYGWEIEFIVPASSGGTAIIDNLRPVHWKNVSLNRGDENDMSL